MKMQNVPLADIVKNPWRDIKLYPINDEHVDELLASISDHGFFGGVKGRRVNGKVQIGCGHMRIEAARKFKPKLETVPIFVDDMDDDAMLRLMTDENATQAGSNPGAIINEVASVTRRIAEGLLEGEIPPPSVARAFENERGMKQTRTKLHMRLTEPDKADIHLAIGHKVIARYLGQGEIKRSFRKEEEIREAITTLKQAGRYDDMVDDVIRRYPPPVDGKKPAKSRAVAKTTPPNKRKPVLDERTANLFPNDHQFQAFRDAVTTSGAQKVLPVSSQLALAKSIMTSAKKVNANVGGPYIKRMVQAHVEQALKEQRNINKEEREQYLREQREERIESELHSANSSLRGLLSALARLQNLHKEFPSHPKIGAFAARLDTLVAAVQQFSKRIK